MTVARTRSPTSTDRAVAFSVVIRRLFTPKWILIHIGVASLIVLMMNLGFWQLRRLDEKKTFNSLVTERTISPVVDLETLGFTSATFGSLNEWRRVSVTGRYHPEHAVTIVNRSQDGTAGYDTLVPLYLTSQQVLFINRGFVPLATKTPNPPTDTITVTGYIRNTQTRGALGAVDSTEVATKEFQRFDIALIGKRITNENVLPYFVQRISETPDPLSEWPAAVALPHLDNGPHLSYAVQWFFFCCVAATAWVVVVRRRLRQPTTNEDSLTDTSA